VLLCAAFDALICDGLLLLSVETVPARRLDFRPDGLTMMRERAAVPNTSRVQAWVLADVGQMARGLAPP